MSTGPALNPEVVTTMPSTPPRRPAPLLLRRMRGHRGLEGEVFQAMVDGWAAEQRRRGLAETTIDSRLLVVRRFVEFCDHYPWRWRMADIDGWTVTLRSGHQAVAPSTMRAYQRTLGMFCAYLRDSDPEWAVVCEECFGVPLARICQQWNTIASAAPSRAAPGSPTLNRQELEAFFDDAEALALDVPGPPRLPGGVPQH